MPRFVFSPNCAESTPRYSRINSRSEYFFNSSSVRRLGIRVFNATKTLSHFSFFFLLLFLSTRLKIEAITTFDRVLLTNLLNFRSRILVSRQLRENWRQPAAFSAAESN